jgi:hypothetical protein
MISEGELRRLAAGRRVDPLILDLDYALGWFLAGLYRNRRLASLLRFKGGTCLSKAYFPNYRFSEDLDFTATGHLNSGQVEDVAQHVADWSEEEGGPDFLAGPPLLETVSDEYGGETSSCASTSAALSPGRDLLRRSGCTLRAMSGSFSRLSSERSSTPIPTPIDCEPHSSPVIRLWRCLPRSFEPSLGSGASRSHETSTTSIDWLRVGSIWPSSLGS